jgi:AcrR family transcriptional regulator
MTSLRNKPAAARSSEDLALDAAREAILAVGWSRTTLTDVARRAGVSRMTIYRRWPEMRALLADLMTREWTAAVEPALRTRTQDPLERIVHGVVTAVRALRDNDLLARITDVDPELLLPYLLDRRGRSQQLVLDLLTTEIRRAQRAGVVRRGNAGLLARSIVLAAHGFTLSAHTMLDGEQPRGADVRRFDRELATIVRRYLQP